MTREASLPIEIEQPLPGACQVSLCFSLEDFPLEELLASGIEIPFSLRSAVQKRRFEFLAARYCAMQAFQQLGLTQIPAVGFAEDRSPVWPEGYMGSLTHTGGIASAIVAPSRAFLALGIDIEHRIDKASSQMVGHICRDSNELQRLLPLTAGDEEEALTLIFSAKESLYKALNPRVKRFFGFQAAEVIADAAGLRIALRVDLSDELRAQQSWPIRWRRKGEDLIETLIAVEQATIRSL